VTLIIGILCKDGVVMASDSAATLGAGNVYTIGQQSLRKVFRLNDHVLYSATGAVGMSQLIADKIKKIWTGNDFSRVTPDFAMNQIGCEIVNTVGPFLQSAGWTRSLVGESNSSLCKTLVAITGACSSPIRKLTKLPIILPSPAGPKYSATSR